MSIALQHCSAKGLFVVGRFRSGTTALWNILRHVSGVRAYYEPCHDSLLEHLRAHTSPDPTHVSVTEYWKEYQPILDSLPRYYRKEFGTDRLCLPEHAEHPDLKDYLSFLLASPPDNAVACLKMNRMDLRLPWLRNAFPHVPVVYIFRNPRDQWVSLFRDQPAAEIDDPYLNSGYDLMVWSANLVPYVPRLGSTDIASSYERHYLIWRISLELAKRYANCMIDFDNELQDEPESGVRKLLEPLGMDVPPSPGLIDLVAQSGKNRWMSYHDSEWFSTAEVSADRYLEETGVIQQIAEGRIFSSCANPLSVDFGEHLGGLIYPLCHVISQCRSVALENARQSQESLGHAHAYIEQLENETRKIRNDSDVYAGQLTHELEKIRTDSDSYIAQLEQELRKIRLDSDTGFQERDRQLEQKSEAYKELERNLERVSRDAADELKRRDDALLVKDQFISSLEQEIKEITTNSRAQLEARDAAGASKDAYLRSLQEEIEKCTRDADLELRARDQAIQEKDRYIESLETELTRLRGG